MAEGLHSIHGKKKRRYIALKKVHASQEMESNFFVVHVSFS
jgi:hypothetical protein